MTSSQPDLFIRDAVLDDAVALVGLLNPIIDAGTFTALDTPLSVAEERDYIAGLPMRAIFLVAIRALDDRLVGCQSVEPFTTGTHAFDHVGVMGTYVDLASHRQGIARRLFAATFERARRAGYEKIFTYVRADNAAGLAAYLGQGFRIVGTAERHAKIRGRYIDEVLIERFLAD
jgi:L-amino acid N-acyltransferase YncA